MNKIITIEWRGYHVVMIDQRKLPHEEIYVKLYSYEEVAQAIETMVIRGAPAIGVAAAMGVALGMKKRCAKEVSCHSRTPPARSAGSSGNLDLKQEFLKIYERLYQTRPTAV